MNEKEYVKNVCNKCLNKSNDTDLCNIVKTMSGDYRCSNEDVIKVGEYVRTENGEIHKVIEIKEDTEDWSYYKYENDMGDLEINIVKHSKNIMDLIEVGDILKIKEDDDICYIGLEKDTITVNYADIKESIENNKCELLAILTHEQYEENCYKLEGV